MPPTPPTKSPPPRLLTRAASGPPLAPPRGLRDVLPAATEALAALSARTVATFARFGYRHVTTPAFEYAEVLERGLSRVDHEEQLRFFEPGTGELALLRPDMTPQIARVVATRLAHLPPPWRLSYHGTVLRRRRGRARLARQATQAGVEHIGAAKAADTLPADREVIVLAASALREVGLDDFVIELSQVRLARHALDDVPEAVRDEAADALARKDVALLERILAPANVHRGTTTRLSTLSSLYGDLGVLRSARRALKDDTSRAALDELERLTDALAAAGLGDHLAVDLGELRGHGYYTGMSFGLLAEGPGEALGRGGRYDDLVGRYGRPAPATGFALDVGHLSWALDACAKAARVDRNPRWVVSDPAESAALRAARVDVAERPGSLESALEFARAWGYDGARVGETWARVEGSIHQSDAVDEAALAFVYGPRRPSSDAERKLTHGPTPATVGSSDSDAPLNNDANHDASCGGQET